MSRQIRASLTTPDLVVLALLAEKPRHGYQLNLELERREVRDWAGVSRPQVYYSLKKLERMKLIGQASEKKNTRGPERQVFTLTPQGQAALARALEREAWATERIPPRFLTWLALSLHARPEAARKVIARRRAFLEAELARERATIQAVRADTGRTTPVPLFMLDLTIWQFEMELIWLQEVERYFG